MPYRPTACRKTYRLVVVRKNLTVEKGEIRLFDDYRYFFYLTNDWDRLASEIVFDANQRCNQENLHAQLKGGVRALAAPVDTLESNWAYMVMTSLAWNLKGDGFGAGGRRKRRAAGGIGIVARSRTVLGMEFKAFANAFLRMPCLIVRTGRRLVYRLLSWNPWQPLFFRTLTQLRC